VRLLAAAPDLAQRAFVGEVLGADEALEVVFGDGWNLPGDSKALGFRESL
jgi:hypothetical protein